MHPQFTALVAARFWSKVNKDGPTVRPELGPCWTWTGRPCKAGYGVVGVNYKLIYAHRFSWEIAHGQITDDLCVLHVCDNRICVRPDHLFLGTRADNIADMIAKGRYATNLNHRTGPDHYRARFSAEEIKRIRARASNGERIVDIGKDYDVNLSSIGKIVKRVTYKSVI